MTTSTLLSILPAVIDLVKQAGLQLAAEFSRPDGPRSSGSETAPIDSEIELFLREHLTTLFPARFVGEEEGVLAAEANGYCWVVIRMTAPAPSWRAAAAAPSRWPCCAKAFPCSAWYSRRQARTAAPT